MRNEEIHNKLDPYNLNNEELNSFGQYKKELLRRAEKDINKKIVAYEGPDGRQRLMIINRKRKFKQMIRKALRGLFSL